MGIWNYYFIAKLYWFFGGQIGLHRWENLCFAALLLIPIEPRWARLLRQLIAIPVGVVLLYHDSWLPPVSRLIEAAPNLASFSGAYRLELMERFFNGQIVAELLALFMVAGLLSLKLRISSFVLLTLLAAPQLSALASLNSAPQQSCANLCPGQARVEKPQTQQAQDADLDTALENFHAEESRRQVIFHKPKAAPAFDIIILQICSLAWDDIDFVHGDASFLKRFDLLFTRFNSGSSYSGPAVIRLLRGNCGQQQHDKLYQDTQPACYLFNKLAEFGFTPNLLLNHTGDFGGFLHDIQDHGGLNIAPIHNLGAVTYLNSFDGTPVFDDYDVLSQWWTRRQSQSTSPVALFYNSSSLHDGNRVPGAKKLPNVEFYRIRLKRLFGDVGRFMTELEDSGRQAVLVFIPEHGAALRGDKIQISGLREIPTAQITLIPVGVKFIGIPKDAISSQIVVEKPSSYLALSDLLARLIEANPYAGNWGDFLPQLERLSITEYEAENEKTVMMSKGERYFMRTPDSTWMEYPK
ncbi:MAG: cellulose biosynthesis protein BcsG [Methylococcaceae bacterium]|nr:cellulose biosynthesis protein BcsG [Methylococcaceae bacterium]